MLDKNYECPTCGTHDRNLYGRCYHPGCPDGHDQYSRPIPADKTKPPLTLDDRKTGRVLWLVVLFIIVSTVYACTSYIAHATDHGFSLVRPRTTFSQWIESLKQPDDTEPKASCCGLGDAYEADVYDIDGYEHGRRLCQATITDGSEKKWPDGTSRKMIADGTQVEFPCAKVNPASDGNPTPHAWIFLNVGYDDGQHTGPTPIYGTYCFIPMQPGS
jgi:hypothetical protein